MTVNNSVSNEKMVGGLPRIGRFLLRNLACSPLGPRPAAGHQCATSLSPLSDTFPAKWSSTTKNIRIGRGCALLHFQTAHLYPNQVTEAEQYLKFVTVVAPPRPSPISPCCSFRLRPAHVRVRTRYSCLCNRSGDVPFSGPPLDERRSV